MNHGPKKRQLPPNPVSSLINVFVFSFTMTNVCGADKDIYMYMYMYTCNIDLLFYSIHCVLLSSSLYL